MPEVHGSESRLYMNGLDVSSLFRELEGGSAHDLVDTTTFGATSDEHIVTPQLKRTITAGGLIDVDPANGAHAALQALNNAGASVTGAQVMVWQARDTTLGDPGLLIVGSVPKPTVKNVIRDVVQTAFMAQSNLSGWCRALKNKASIAAAGSAVGLNHGAPTTAGGISVLQVMSITGTTPVLTVKTQHSSDSTNGVDGTWVDLATHAAINTAGVAAGYADVQQVAAGTVNKWLRHTLAVTSGSLSNVVLAHQFVRIP